MNPEPEPEMEDAKQGQPPPAAAGKDGTSRRRTTVMITSMAVLVVAAAAIAAIVLLTTGSGNSPSGAAGGMLSAIYTNHPATSCQYIVPSQQHACGSFWKKEAGKVSFSGHLVMAQTAIQGNRALVSVTGRGCARVPKKHPSCQSNSNPRSGLPSAKVDFQQAFANATSPSGGANVVPCMKVKGRWYVDALFS
ncbi:MAG: hypothetical protein M1399_09030 [Actinobacteria bacterium]|nr:hypothetical protein [Actinomycetota bacterium]MCL5446870.1 hypothetical protein [Actinomycetota bacterium]